MRRSRGLFIAVLGLLLLMQMHPRAGSDFPVAFTNAVEEMPAIAYNSQTNQYLVAYRIKYTDLSGLPHYGVQCQLLNASGEKVGSVLYPFGDLGAIDALGRPAIAYNRYQNIYFLAVAEHAMSGGYDNVIGRFLNGDGTNRIGPDFLFNDSAKTPYFITGSGTGSLRVVYNHVVDEFLVTVQREVSHADPVPERHNTVAAQRISESSGTSAIVEIEDADSSTIDSHAIGCAPVAGTTPEGGRYVFVYDGGIHLYAKLLDSQLNFITDIPMIWATPQWGARDPDIAYGEVGGVSQILVVFTDSNACAPGHQTCAGQMQYQWTGVWGVYIDPFAESYQTDHDSSFPISIIHGHSIISSWPIQAPSVSYSTAAKGFFVAWREAPSIDAQNGEIRSHIRGAFVDYFVEFRDLSPWPTNVVISDVTGAICTTGAWCPSDQDPEFPAVAGGSGLSAAVVWQQKYPPNPTDIDVMGDIYIAAPLRPDLVESALANPPANGSPGLEIVVSDTVENLGTESAGPSTTRYYLSTDTIKSRYDIPLGSRAVPALTAGAASAGSIGAVIPGDTGLETYYLLACADGLGAVTELDETNNCRASTSTIVITAATPPDLVETSVSNPPTSATKGTAIEVTDTTGNQGGTPAAASTTRYYLSLDTSKNAGDTLLAGSRSVPALAAGATSSGTVPVTIPTLTASGTYYLLACADDTGVVAESNEGNNCIASAGTVVIGLQGKPTASDFDGDKKSDILWRHNTGGHVWLWLMNGASRTAESFVRTVADTNWEIRGLGDQTGDGKADILWRNKITGQIYLWPMDGSTPLSETYVATVNPAYDIVGTGDYDGDGKSDILWRRLTNGEVWIWLMNGATPLSQVHVDTVDSGYVVKGSGDLNGDTKADIVWHHGTLGQVWVWLMNGTSRTSQTHIGTVPDVGYKIMGVADHTGDGKADILWHHATRGEVWIWPMNGTTVVSQSPVGTVSDTGYQIVGSGDYNGDTKADILWHHATRGEVWVWLMNGTTKTSETWVGTVPDVGYQIVKVK